MRVPLFVLTLALSSVAFGANAAMAPGGPNGMTCVLEARGIEPQSIPLVYDGMQKKFELSFMVEESAPDTFNFHRLTPEDTRRAYRQMKDRSERALDRARGHVPLASKISRFYRGILAERNVDRLFQVVEVELFPFAGELRPDTNMRTTLRDAAHWGVTEDSMRVRNQVLRVCEPNTLQMTYLNLDEQLSSMPATIRCDCGSYAIPDRN